MKKLDNLVDKTFDIEKFNVISDEENYYFLRSLEPGDIEDLEKILLKMAKNIKDLEQIEKDGKKNIKKSQDGMKIAQ